MNFIFTYFNLIVLAVWAIFFVVVVVRVFRPEWLRNIAYSWLIGIAVSIHLLWGLSATWLQYLHWGTISQLEIYLTAPLNLGSPLYPLPDFFRPLFSGEHGYFTFYALQHFFLISIALFVVTGLFALFFKAYAQYRPALFKEEDIAIIALSFLIAGWYGAIVLVPVGFAAALVFVLTRLLFGKTNQVSIASVFLIMAPFAFVFAIPILAFFSLYQLLKL